MKKLFVLLILTFLAAGALFAQTISRGSTAWVASKSAVLKSSTWFFAGTRGTLNLADRVMVLQVKGNYAEVESIADSSLTGWVALSNLSGRRIVASGTIASATEIALAGKGKIQSAPPGTAAPSGGGSGGAAETTAAEEGAASTGAEHTEAPALPEDEPPEPASGGVLSLAKKGFTREVEDAYKAEKNLDYSGVDNTETIAVSQDELYGFIVEGRLFIGEEE